LPQFHLMPQYPQTFGYLVKTPVNLR
jgi:hypothetical protein